MRAVPQRVLEELEDRHADLLIGPAVAAGAVAIVAPVARAWIDLNRAPEGDKEGRHARAGLGLVPSRLGEQGLWDAEPSPDDVAIRVTTVHDPYHDAIAAALAAAWRSHGYAVLIDCHSMPPIRRGAGAGANLVIGDRHGRSADRAMIGAIAAEARSQGRVVSCNAPYSGAYTLDRHGRPAAAIHAVQIEIDRSLYLDRALRAPGAGIGAIAQLFADLCRAALSAAERAPLLHAAE